MVFSFVATTVFVTTVEAASVFVEGFTSFVADDFVSIAAGFVSTFVDEINSVVLYFRTTAPPEYQ